MILVLRRLMAFAGEHLHNGFSRERQLMGKEKKVPSLVLLLCFSRQAGGAVSRVEIMTAVAGKEKKNEGTN